MSQIGHNNPPEQTIFRNAQKGDRYTVILNDMIQDDRLSYDHIGLLTYLLSQPMDWLLVAKSLIRGGCKKDKLYRLLAELTQLGYVGFEEKRDDKNQFLGRQYWVSDKPFPVFPETGQFKQADLIPETPKKPIKTTVSDISEGEAVSGIPASGKTESGIKEQTNKKTNLKVSQKDRSDLQIALDEYNHLADDVGLPRCRLLNKDRTKKLRLRLDEHGLDGWRQALANIERSSFLCGDKGDWKASFDFLMQPSSFLKTIEGQYGNGRVRKSNISPERKKYLMELAAAEPSTIREDIIQ